MAEMKLSELAERVGGRLEGDGGKVIRGVAPVETAGGDEVTFLSNRKYERHVGQTSAGAVIVPEDYSGPQPPAGALIRCKDSYFAFREAMVAFHGFRTHPFEGVDPRADIHPTASLSPGARVGAFVTIARGATIGAGAVIYPGCYVGESVRMGDGCTLYPNVTLYDGTVLHDRVTIHAGTSIGHDGFGYATHAGPDKVVRHEKIPQAGWVEIESDVEIGAGCAIDRATMGATVIGAGTKFSNLVAIGHGTRLGKHCLLVAQAGLAGSVMVEDYCVFAGQAGVVGHIRIGRGAKIAAQAGVTADVPAGQEMGGSPAIPLPEVRRSWMVATRLPQLRSAVKRLARQVQALKKRLGVSDADEPEDF